MSNGLKWQFIEATMYTSERVDELQKAIRDSGAVKESEDGMVYSFCLLLVHTRSVLFDAAKVQSESLKKLPDFLAAWEKASPAQLWDYRRKHISHSLFNQWGNDFSGEGSLFMADPAELPEDMLTEAQREDLVKNPNGPLE